jgi:hypothetical protein
MGAPAAPILAGTLALGIWARRDYVAGGGGAAACYFWSHFLFGRRDLLRCRRSSHRLPQACPHRRTPEIKQRLTGPFHGEQAAHRPRAVTRAT